MHDRAAAAPASEQFGGVFHFQSAQSASADGFGGRPAAWCGWEMRHLVSSDPGAEYNLARNWAHWGRPGPAGVGAVVVWWPHHVGKIVGQENGQWVIESGNTVMRCGAGRAPSPAPSPSVGDERIPSWTKLLSEPPGKPGGSSFRLFAIRLLQSATC